MNFIEEYFKSLEYDFKKASRLYSSNVFKLEGLTILICLISSLSVQRYPNIKDDRKSYKKLLSEYSGYNKLYENIDLLFYYQQPISKLANDGIYSRLDNKENIKAIFESEFGEIDDVRNFNIRYQKREDLISVLEKESWFDKNNFSQYIELFSNNQIFYQYARCDAVHNYEFPLINRGIRQVGDKWIKIYTDNHQITGDIVLDSLKNVITDLKAECLSRNKNIYELDI